MAKRFRVLFFLLAVIMSAAPIYGESEDNKKENKKEFKKWIKANFEAVHYQQTEPKMVDPKGDAFLIRKLDQIPMKILQSLVKSSYPQAEIQKEKELKALEEAKKDELGFEIGKTVPIDVDRLLNKCRQIMLAYYPNIVPELGEEHEWSPEAKRYLAYGFWHRFGRHIFRKQKEFPSPLFFRSKIFLLLACGWTSRYAMVIFAHISPPKTLMSPKSHSRLFQTNSRKNKPDQLLEEHQKQKKTTQAG